MIKKTKLYLFTGVVLLINAIFCFGVFVATYNEKKSAAAAFLALALSFGATAGAVFALYASKEKIRLSDLRKAISEKDHWFHSFEYPECREPEIDIDTTFFPSVETED